MTITDLIVQILSSAFNIVLPFGFTFGIFCVFCWSIPLLIRLIKKIF